MLQIRINYANSNSIFIINQYGKVKQLFVPIRVKCILSQELIRENSLVYVEQVEAHHIYRIVYRIFDTWYPYNCFRIQF